MSQLDTYGRVVAFTPRAAILTIVAIFVLLLPLWAFRQKAPKAPKLSGQWVGTATMTGYVAGLGQTQRLHTPAVIEVDLEVYDGFLNKYKGTGHLVIQGESTPRKVDIVTLWPPQSNGKMNGEVAGQFFRPDTPSALAQTDAARILEGNLDGSQLKLYTTDDSAAIGYIFTADLHRGSLAELDSQMLHIK